MDKILFQNLASDFLVMIVREKIDIIKENFFTDMRKACSRDVNKTSVIPLSHPVRPEEVD